MIHKSWITDKSSSLKSHADNKKDPDQCFYRSSKSGRSFMGPWILETLSLSLKRNEIIDTSYAIQECYI